MTMKIGAITTVNEKTLPRLFDRIVSLGLNTCQVVIWNIDFYQQDFDKKVALFRQRMAETGVTPSAIWAGYSGRVYWNFLQGPSSLGLVPPEHRWHRLQELKRAADFAAAVGVRAIITHAGFLPENACDPQFMPMVVCITEIAEYCKKLGIEFWFETGQETPVTLLRFIETVGTGNLGINLDPANLLLYGKGNPIDALHVFGKYVRNIHVKDGMAPTNGNFLGEERQVGQGMVDFPRFIRTLKQIGFDGEYIIEREIGEETAQQTKDIIETIGNLRRWNEE